jgi:hypothetical protein
MSIITLKSEDEKEALLKNEQSKWKSRHLYRYSYNIYTLTPWGIKFLSKKNYININFNLNIIKRLYNQIWEYE